MLKPYVCVACEKVIVGKDDVASLIGLFSKIILNVPEGTEIQRDAVGPHQWNVFSVWDHEPGDEGREWTLCTQVLYPDKSPFAQAIKARIPIEPNKRAQMNVTIMGFPVGQPGEHTVRTWIERDGERVFGPIEFGIGLEVRRQEPPSPPSTTPPR